MHFRTHFTKTFMFKLKVTKQPEVAHRYEIYVKEISILGSLILGVLFLVTFCILLTCSIFRQREQNKKTEYEEQLEVFGTFSSSKSIDKLSYLDCSPLLDKRETLSRDCENGETPRWASQRYHYTVYPPSSGSDPDHSYQTLTTSTHFLNNSNSSSLIPKPVLTAHNKNFTSPSLR